MIFESTRQLERAPRSLRRGDTLPASELLRLVRAIADDRVAWEPVLELPDGANRWWTRLHAEQRFDLWLLSWLPSHRTDLHDHGPSAAAFAVACGALLETRVDARGGSRTYLRRTGEATSLARGVIHDVNGAGDRPAVSIHAYSPPLREMNYYVRDARGLPRQVRSMHTAEPEQRSVR